MSAFSAPATTTSWFKKRARGESLATLGAAGVLVMSLLYVPGKMPPISQCLLSEVTGVPCPLCGMTRSFCAAAKGRLAEALAWHPLGPVLFAATVAVLLIGLYDVFAERDLLRSLTSRIPLDNPRLYLGAYGILWIAKLAAFDLLGM